MQDLHVIMVILWCGKKLVWGVLAEAEGNEDDDADDDADDDDEDDNDSDNDRYLQPYY